MTDLPLTEEQNKIVEAHISYAEALTVQLMKKRPKFLKFDEAFSEALLGLCVAAQRYTKDKNIKFTTYSYFYIFKYVIEYIKRESKRLYGKQSIKDSNQVICSLEVVKEKDIEVIVDSNETLWWVLDKLPYMPRCVLAYTLAGYNKKEISQELEISIQGVNNYMEEAKKQICEELNRPELMQQQPADMVKKKRGRPKKVQSTTVEHNLESMIAKQAPEVTTFIQEPTDITHKNEPTINTVSGDFINNYKILYDVGSAVYIGVFRGEKKDTGRSLTKEFKYRPIQTKVIGIVLKCNNQVNYLTAATKKTYIDSECVFSCIEDCEAYCKILNKE